MRQMGRSMRKIVTRLTGHWRCAADSWSMTESNSPPPLPIEHEQILRAAAATGTLGPSAHSGPRMMAMLCDPLVAARDLVTLIEKDPAMCARVLRVANSPYYGQARAIRTIGRALLVLGLDAVRGIAAAACLDRTMSRAGTDIAVDLQALTRHSIATAAAAEMLAISRREAPPAEAFIGGLLHHLGVVVQLRIDPSAMRAIVRSRHADPEAGIRDLEGQHRIVGHEQCVAVIFDAWHLPDSLVAASRHHHEPLEAPLAHRKLAATVNLGAHLGLACGYAFGLETSAGTPHAGALSVLGMGPEDLAGIRTEAMERVAQLQRALLDV